MSILSQIILYYQKFRYINYESNIRSSESLAFIFVCNQILQINMKNFCNLLKGRKVRLNPITSIGINHTKAFIYLFSKPCLRYPFFG